MSLSLFLVVATHHSCHGLSLSETASPLRSLTIYARLILVEIHTRAHTRARAHSRLSIPRISRRRPRISRGAISKSHFRKPDLNRSPRLEIPSLAANQTIFCAFSVQNGIIKRRATRNAIREFIVRLFGKQEASVRSKIGENCVVTYERRRGFFFCFELVLRVVGCCALSFPRFISFISFSIRLPFYFYSILFYSCRCIRKIVI